MESPKTTSRIPELDGIRGLAILSVLCYHYISIQGLASPGSIVDILQRLVMLGGTGVDLFFVLSGFLIGGILLYVKDSPRYFSTFYVRRFFRIIPVYFAPWFRRVLEVVPLQRAFAMEAPGYSVIAFFYVALLLAALCIPGGLVSNVTRSSLLRKIGAISYCMYLIHIVVDVARHAVILRGSPKIATPRAAAVTIFAAILTFVIAQISWRIFEKPLLKRGHAFRY